MKIFAYKTNYYYKIIKVNTYRESRVASRSDGLFPKFRDANLHRAFPFRWPSAAVFIVPIISCQVYVVSIVHFDKNVTGLRCNLE